MPDPLWEIELTDQAKEIQREYREKLVRKAWLSGMRRGPNSTKVERAYDRQDAFEAFIRGLLKHGLKHRDPQNLPPAADENGAVIPDCFCFDDDPWTAFIYRDQENGRALVVMIFEEADRLAMLARFSTVTR